MNKLDVYKINELYKLFSLAYYNEHNVGNQTVATIDEIAQYIEKGIFEYRKVHYTVSIIVPTAHCESYLTDKTKYYVGFHKANRQRSIKERNRLSHVFDYVHERDPWLGFKLRNGGQRYICPECMNVNRPCDCKVETVRLSPTAKVPRRNASKTRWNQFKKQFNL